MLKQALTLALVCTGLTVATLADDSHNHAPAATQNDNFEKLKTLVGTWVAADADGKPTDQVISEVKLTAGGSAIHETLFPGKPEEMISIYTLDGSDIIMTHYCMLGNAPKMKARTNGDKTQFNFEFDGGTNFDPKKDMHMHSAVLTILDDDHLRVEGVAWDNGKPSQESCETMHLVRKK